MMQLLNQSVYSAWLPLTANCLSRTGSRRLNTTQCWQRLESTITLETTSSSERLVENTSEFVRCQSLILEIRTLFDQCQLEMGSKCDCFIYLCKIWNKNLFKRYCVVESLFHGYEHVMSRTVCLIRLWWITWLQPDVCFQLSGVHRVQYSGFPSVAKAQQPVSSWNLVFGNCCLYSWVFQSVSHRVSLWIENTNSYREFQHHMNIIEIINLT
jgi:hypothetical protein